ncbi:MAG: T9SS type A sorting domain-containing protein, partial [bacterium]
LQWTTSSEINNSGFNIERKLIGVSDWTTIGNVIGNGTSNNSHNYTFSDRNVVNGKYSYRLKQIDFNGNYEYHNLNSEVELGAPTKFSLYQNYPNPFNPTTKINYDLVTEGNVSLKIYNMSGKEVATLVNGFIASGYHSVTFDATGISSGIYYYKLEANGISKVMKMALIK